MKRLVIHTNSVTQKQTGKIHVHRKKTVSLMPIVSVPGVQGMGEGRGKKDEVGGVRRKEKMRRGRKQAERYAN